MWVGALFAVGPSASQSSEVRRDRHTAGCQGPRGRRAHVRAGRLGSAGRLGRRGHQDRARGAGRCHAGPRLDGSGSHPERRPCAARALEPGEAEPGSRPDLAEGLDILYKLAGTADVFLTNKLPSVRVEAEDRRGRDSRPRTPASSTCAGRVRASVDRTPTRGPTMPWRSGPDRAWRQEPRGPNTTSFRSRRRRGSATPSAP